MSVEIEVKYLLDASSLKALETYAPIVDHTDEAPRKKRLISTYFDNPAFALKANKIALRVRETGTGFVQTVKGAAVSVDGLSKRKEVEWDIDSANLDLDKLAASDFATIIKDAGADQLVPVFVTDFERDLRYLKLNQDTVVELAVDQGFVEANGQREDICELELELKSGSQDVLVAFCTALKDDLKLTPGNESKAKRGYALFAKTQK